MFPALYRYLLYSSLHKFDIFSEGDQKSSEWEWTNSFMSKLQLRPDQQELIKQFEDRLKAVHQNTSNKK